MSEDFEARLASLEARVAALEPQPTPVAVTGVCAVGVADPASCEFASLYRRRKGCDGQACIQASSDYYKRYHQRVAGDDVNE